jgi:hypothetical protein
MVRGAAALERTLLPVPKNLPNLLNHPPALPAAPASAAPAAPTGEPGALIPWASSAIDAPLFPKIFSKNPGFLAAPAAGGGVPPLGPNILSLRTEKPLAPAAPPITAPAISPNPTESYSGVTHIGLQITTHSFQNI